jgi:hypothetical protein
MEKAVNKWLVSPAVKESLTDSHIAPLGQVLRLVLHQISTGYGILDCTFWGSKASVVLSHPFPWGSDLRSELDFNNHNGALT